MDNRKRQRLEVTPSASATATLTTTALPTAIALPTTTIGAQSFFLSSSGSNHDNVLLTICDEQSDESEEYLTLDDDALTAATTHIKREQLENVLPLQYRIVNTLRNAGVDASNCCSNNNISSVNSTTNTLPTSVQLPSGCDIYLVKEYMETTSTPTNTVKLEANESNVILQHNLSTQCLRPKPMASTTTTTAATAGTVGGDTQAASKRSFILETYKKRDDRRRATHNEVERRRRDKINSWIFKLKEMLPEMPQTSGGSGSSTGNNNNNGNSNTSGAFNNSNTNNSHINNNCNNNQNTINTTASCSTSNNSSSSSCRATSGDSKSQILIKACEYIKTMQAELQSLRECLTENENLRLSNQRLQNELDQLRNEPSNISSNSNNNHNNSSSNSSNIICNNQLVSNKNHSYNLTLNSLNSNGSIFSTSSPAANAAAAAAAAAALTTYTKRELIIRDYVD